MPIPIIDIFAGPGGLGEGFSRLQDSQGRPVFQTALSIEMDSWARETLKLRAFVRAAKRSSDKALRDFRALRGLDRTVGALYELHPKLEQIADAEAWQRTLGPDSVKSVRDRIKDALGNSANDWILIGGPPCQAYSLVGRSRNMGKSDYVFEEDYKTQLYLEYLQIVADHAPAVFVMENVKGLLSARYFAEAMFTRIQEDLEDPAKALRGRGRTTTNTPKYDLHTIAGTTGNDLTLFSNGSSPREFLVKAETHGVPQARHRVIVVGVRKGLAGSPSSLERSEASTVKKTIGDLPRLRSGLSLDDSPEQWQKVIRSIGRSDWLGALSPGIRETIEAVATNPRVPRGNRGLAAQARTKVPEWNPEWFGSAKLDWIWQHSTRGHIAEDLARYLFASAWAKETNSAPQLGDFPRAILPKHQNARAAAAGGPFSDRFRVQVDNRPSTTITSHISRDGHYYIHYDPTQCRSLTVREAARLQTFPDDYYFCGPRTSQYVQVGNAVPPFLAWQIGASIAGLLGRNCDGQPLP